MGTMKFVGIAQTLTLFIQIKNNGENNMKSTDTDSFDLVDGYLYVFKWREAA